MPARGHAALISLRRGVAGKTGSNMQTAVSGPGGRQVGRSGYIAPLQLLPFRRPRDP